MDCFLYVWFSFSLRNVVNCWVLLMGMMIFLSWKVDIWGVIIWLNLYSNFFLCSNLIVWIIIYEIMNVECLKLLKLILIVDGYLLVCCFVFFNKNVNKLFYYF